MRRKNKKTGVNRDTMMDHGYHSHFYHTFFEDYVERARTDNKGTKRVIRTYIGDYYYSSLTVLQRRGVKTAYILLFCFTVFFYLKAAGMPVESNFQWYVTVPEAIDLFLMLWFLKTIIYYVTAKKEMTIGEYKSTSKALMQISAVSAAGFGLTAAVLLVSLFRLQKTAETGAILLCAADMLLCGVCMAAVFVMEKTMRYTKRAAAVKPQADDSYM